MRQQDGARPAFGIGLWGSLDARILFDEVQLVERLGYDAVWIGDSQLLWREAYVIWRFRSTGETGEIRCRSATPC